MSDLDIPRTHAADAPEDSSASVAADKYDQMLALADLFDSSGNEMRTRARLGTEILGDDDVVDTAELSRATWGQAEEDIRAATTGKHGLLTRSVELDADALRRFEMLAEAFLGMAHEAEAGYRAWGNTKEAVQSMVATTEARSPTQSLTARQKLWSMPSECTRAITGRFFAARRA